MSDTALTQVHIHVVAGFLGAGKTTFINKLLIGAADGQTAIIENEAGNASIDDYLLEETGLEVKTLSSGCICCSLKIGFVETIRALVRDHDVRQAFIEPTGMASPDDVLAACDIAARDCDVDVASVITIVDASRAERMIRIGIPAFSKQLSQARFVVLSHVDGMADDQIASAIAAIREQTGRDVEVIGGGDGELDVGEVLLRAEEAYVRSSDGGAAEGRADDGRHDHRDHHDHGSDLDVLTLSPRSTFSDDDISWLSSLLEEGGHGRVLRAKGFLPGPGDAMLHYEYVLGCGEARPSSYRGSSKLVVIGEHLDRGFFESELDGFRFPFFTHVDCPHFPCHEGLDRRDFNCLFCYCPLYALGPRCGGRFRYTESGVKDCTACAVIHVRDDGTRLAKEKFPLLKQLAGSGDGNSGE